MAKVEIYTQPWCPFCERAMHILSTKSVAFQEIDAPHGSTAREDAKRRSGGRTTVPQIFIDGQHIGGCDDLYDMESAGELDALLAERVMTFADIVGRAADALQTYGEQPEIPDRWRDLVPPETLA